VGDNTAETVTLSLTDSASTGLDVTSTQDVSFYATNLWQFETNSDNTTSFTATVNKSGANCNWDMGDGTTFTGTNSVSHIYSSGAVKTVTVSLDDTSFVKDIRLDEDGVVGHLIMPFPNLGFETWLRRNPDMTGVTFLPSNVVCTRMRLEECGLTGVLDLPFTRLRGDVRIHTNPNLTKINFANSNEPIYRLRAYGCNLTGTQDVPFTRLKTEADFSNNPMLTELNFATTGELITKLRLNNCSLGLINWSAFTASNDNIEIRLADNNMSAAEVNQNLAAIDAKGWENGSLTIDGSNAAPNGTSGGVDGNDAVSSLIAKGWTVQTT